MAKRPSSWVNLQDYLDLNQEAGAEMGQRLVGDVGAQAAKAGGAITSAETEFGYKSRAGTLGDPDDAARVHGANANLYSPEEAQAMAMGGYSGPNSLGDLNPDLFGQVQDAVSRVKAAQDPALMGNELAKAYGGQAASGAGGNALDAFLTGQTSAAALSGLNDSYGGLMESLGIAEKGAMEKAAKATERSNEAANKWSELVPILKGHGETEAGEEGQWRPEGYTDWKSFIDPTIKSEKEVGQFAHEAAMYASPADWATRGLGELGYDGENVSQLFSKMFGANGNQAGGTGHWNIGNLRSASRLVQDQYGPQAMEAWFNSLDEKSWSDLMNKGNAGAQARLIRAWLNDNGYQRLR